MLVGYTFARRMHHFGFVLVCVELYDEANFFASSILLLRFLRDSVTLFAADPIEVLIGCLAPFTRYIELWFTATNVGLW